VNLDGWEMRDTLYGYNWGFMSIKMRQKEHENRAKKSLKTGQKV